MKPGPLALVWLAILMACSAPALLGDLSDAERLEREGKKEQALAAYAAAQTSCKRMRNKRRRRDTCAQAHIGAAELLEDLDRRRDAAAAYEITPAALDHDPIPSAKATYRAGRLRLAMGEEVRGYQLLWKTVTDYPDVAFAVDALRVVYFDGRRRNARQLYEVLGELVEPLAGNEVSDNILYSMAQLAEHDFASPKIALAHYDQITAEYREGGLYDEALWHSARLARLTGDPRGATKRLRLLLATREVAMGVGSYFSVWLDDAQLELGKLLRDDLDDPRGAVKAFERLLRDYPASILHDDAIFETAVTWDQAGDVERACRSLQHLAEKWPDSKYQIERAPALRGKLDCGKIGSEP